MLPAWGALGLRAACAHGTMDEHGVDWLNGIAASTARALSACYVDGRGADDPLLEAHA